MVPCGSSPVARLYLVKNEAPEEEADKVSPGTNPIRNEVKSKLKITT